MAKKRLHLWFIGFLQAVGFLVYAGLVAALVFQGNNLFGDAPNFYGALLFLILFVVSALISALIVLGYPFILFWEKKETMQALKLIGYTTAWLILFTLTVIFILTTY